VFENCVFRGICGPKWVVVTGWRKLHNDNLYNLYSSPHIIKMIKWRMSWVGHVAHIEELRSALRLQENPKGGHHSEVIDERKILS
jgi:hypothetical protein